MKTDKSNFQQERAAALIQYHDLLECYIIGACYRTWNSDAKNIKDAGFDTFCRDVQRSVADYLIKLEPMKDPDSLQSKIATQAMRICTATIPVYASFVVQNNLSSKPDADIEVSAHEMYTKLDEADELVYDCPCCGKPANVYRFSESPTSKSLYVVCCSDTTDDSAKSTQPTPCVLSLPTDDFNRPTVREAVIFWNNYRNYCEHSKQQSQL